MMLALLPFINIALAIVSIASQALTVAVVLLLIFKKDSPLIAFLGKYAIGFVFLVALGALVGSIYYSDGAGFVPCTLCWYERILLYPQFVIAWLALRKREREVGALDSILVLSVLGAIVAAYHQYLQLGGVSVLPCAAHGVSCAERFVFEFGYITIPMMALSAFLLNIVFILARKRSSA